MQHKDIVIIGGGPAGLTAAYELAREGKYRPIVIEADTLVGGISKTFRYKGNHIDIGGHRFFTKSDKVMNWWLQILPIEEGYEGEFHPKSNPDSPLHCIPKSVDPEETDEVMLVRNRLSRIYFNGKFFDYPISLSAKLFMDLGLVKVIKVGVTYLLSRVFPRKDEKTLEDFLVNRFGSELYKTFFKSYTEKVWGVPCSEISSEWGAQRIKGLSIMKILKNAVQKIFRRSASVKQANIETSLIERFLYPKFGPGQLWEKVVELATEKGAEIRMQTKVVGIKKEGDRIVSVTCKNLADNSMYELEGDQFISTMPVKNLIESMGENVPEDVSEVATNLRYRDFITVGVLANKMGRVAEKWNGLVPDNWIYVHEPNVHVGRIQVFNNWSEHLVSDPQKVWMGLEYFCNEDDSLWSRTDKELMELAQSELVKLGFVDEESVLDSVVLKVPKAYPAYFGSYDQFDTVRDFTDSIENLYLVGRNGMHKYNNQDHSMLTAMEAVEAIKSDLGHKQKIWQVNVDQEYHEQKAS